MSHSKTCFSCAWQLGTLQKIPLPVLQIEQYSLAHALPASCTALCIADLSALSASTAALRNRPVFKRLLKAQEDAFCTIIDEFEAMRARELYSQAAARWLQMCREEQMLDKVALSTCLRRFGLGHSEASGWVRAL